MKKGYFIIVLMLFVVTSGFAQKETRKVDDFSGISMGVAADLILTQGGTTKVIIEGDKDELEEIVTEVKGSTLVIKYKNNRGWKMGNNKVDIYITTPEIDEISLGGSGSIVSENKIVSNSLELNVSGSGKIKLEVNADELTQRISGSGSIKLTGDADRAKITISGSGNLNAEELDVDHYEIRISGSGKCRINAGDSIEANISGSGSVYYKGEPDKIISNVSGSGKVRKL